MWVSLGAEYLVVGLSGLQALKARFAYEDYVFSLRVSEVGSGEPARSQLCLQSFARRLFFVRERRLI